MATFRKRGNSWQVRVRRLGYPDEVKTLPTKFDAEQWARFIESDMDRGPFVSKNIAEQTSFGDVIRRYMKEITPGNVADLKWQFDFRKGPIKMQSPPFF